MKKVRLLLIAIGIIVIGAISFFIWNANKVEVDGRWELATEPNGCFTEVYFPNDNPFVKGLSVYETEGNHTQVWFGIYERKGSDQLTVELTNPTADPFIMTASQQNETLNLKYEWKGTEYSCNYTPSSFSN